jgi:p-aminobenzoyl-glutamate transporter AbgT
LLVHVIYFWQIGNSWFNMALSGFIYCVISFIITLFVPESPRLLLANGKCDEFKAAMNTLARWNKKEINWNSVQLDERIKSFQKLNP